MMNRAWWERIQAQSPLALEDCLDQFRIRYPDRWREEIRVPARLLHFFAEQSIAIQLLWYHDNRGQKRYGFRIKSDILSITGRYRWSEEETAYAAALSWGFALHQKGMEYRQHSRQVPVRFPKKEPRRR
ncbi:MAG: hypothetical protein NWR67_08805 [Saprospiraceae bacterium]|jgi:hypothetical protein|nr:hypothetical protein [Saprospiraceae bacterium]MDP4998419.1 hypothetical protein [Saprospiraceae bacterium]